MSEDSDSDDNNKRGPPPVAVATTGRQRLRPRAMRKDIGESAQEALDKQKLENEQLKQQIAAMRAADVARLTAEKAFDEDLLNNPDGEDT